MAFHNGYQIKGGIGLVEDQDPDCLIHNVSCKDDVFHFPIAVQIRHLNRLLIFTGNGSGKIQISHGGIYGRLEVIICF